LLAFRVKIKLPSCFGSVRYIEFLQGLGHLLRLKDCNLETENVGGLEEGEDGGQFAYAWHDDFMQGTGIKFTWYDG
jgi:hypothetical protein